MGKRLLLLGVVFLSACSGLEQTDVVESSLGNQRENINNPKPAYGYYGYGTDYDGDKNGYSHVEQGLNDSVRQAWWFTTQGSRIIPYDWFLALEKADSEERFRSDKNLRDFGFLPVTRNDWNIDGLPIGFVREPADRKQTGWAGITCAACHTGEIRYEKEDREKVHLLIEGGPSLADFTGFLNALSNAMQATRNDEQKWQRFLTAVSSKLVSEADKAALGKTFDTLLKALHTRDKLNHPVIAEGHGRLDAFGNIFNEVVDLAIKQPENARQPSAPVSYPVVWDSPFMDRAQWNGVATNAGVGPMIRNIGEVIGVFGSLHVTEKGDGVSLKYTSTANITNLAALEYWLRKISSPRWKDTSLPTLDKKKVERGRGLYTLNCVSCHARLTDRSDPERKVAINMVPNYKIGTDQELNLQAFNRISKTGMMQGTSRLPYIDKYPNFVRDTVNSAGKLFGKDLRGELRFPQEDLAVSMLGAASMGVLMESGAPVGAADVLAFMKGSVAIKSSPPAYKARPLNGVWASAPYLHNGSVPSLWFMLQKPELRPKRFMVGNPDFDPITVGYVSDRGPFEFDTSLPGNRNIGHPFGTHLSDDDKWALIEYLKTL